MKAKRWAITLAAAALLSPLGLMLAVRAGAAETYTDRVYDCVVEANEQFEECLADNYHTGFFRRAWHDARCASQWVLNEAMCYPSQIF